MSVTDFWVGNNTLTTCEVVCRSDTTETITVTSNGGSFTGDADTSVNDGVVKINVAGLDPNTSYPYTVDGQTGTLKTLSTGGIIIATGSCWEGGFVDDAAYKLMADFDLDLYIALGDFPYAGTSLNLYGENPTSVTDDLAANTAAENYFAHHRQCRKFLGIKELMRQTPFMYMGDDHEYPFDNAARDLTEYRNSPDITSWSSGATQQNMDDAFTAARAAISAYSIGNPVNSDASIDADALYARKTLGNDLVEIFLLDCMNYRSAVSATDNASKTMLGATQKAWIKARLLASTATYKVLALGKMFWNGGPNSDTYVEYSTELNEILAFIDDNNIAGVFALVGDQHFPSIQYKTSPPMLCVVGCPTAQNLNSVGQGVGYNNNIIWKYGKNTGTGPEVRVSNVVTFNPEFAEISLIAANRENPLWTGRIYAGSNILVYPELGVAI